MSFLPNEIAEDVLMSMKKTIDEGNSIRKHLQKNNCIEKIPENILSVLNVKFDTDYTLDISSNDARAIEIPITNTKEVITPLTLKVRTPLVDVEEITPEVAKPLSKTLMNAVLSTENKYIINSILARSDLNEITATNNLEAVEEAVYNATDYVDVSNFLLIVNPASRNKFLGRTEELNSVQRVLKEELGVKTIINSAISTIDTRDGTVQQALLVPLHPDIQMLAQIFIEEPKILKDPINMAVALGMKERIAHIIKTPEAISRIALA